MDSVIIGHWAFVLGLVLAVIAGFGGQTPALLTVLVLLGLIVGFLNIAEKESTNFLVGVIVLLLVGSSGLDLDFSFFYSDYLDPFFSNYIVPIFSNITAFVASAGLVVAVKQVLGIAKKERSNQV